MKCTQCSHQNILSGFHLTVYVVTQLTTIFDGGPSKPHPNSSGYPFFWQGEFCTLRDRRLYTSSTELGSECSDYIVAIDMGKNCFRAHT